MAILDANILVKLFLEEDDSDRARRLVQDRRAAGETIRTSAIALYEVAEALRRSGSFNAQEIQERVASLAQACDVVDLASSSNLAASFLGLANQAIVHAVASRTTVYDGAFVAAAVHTQENLWSHDSPLLNRIQHLGIGRDLRQIPTR